MSDQQTNQPEHVSLLNQANFAQPEDEISLFDLLVTLLKRKRMILVVTVLAALLSGVYSLTLKNIYRAETVLVPVGEEGKNGAASMLGGLGGLASLAGVSLGGGGNTEQNLAVLKSREFIWKFVQDKNLLPILFEESWDSEKKRWKIDDPKQQPGQREAFEAFASLIYVEENKKTSLITVALEWKDKQQAADWVNALVKTFNQYLGEQAIARSEANMQYLKEELTHTQIEEMRKTLFDLIAQEEKKAMLAKTQKDFAFQVLDHAVAPDKKIKPKRALIVALATLAAFVLAVITAFIQESIGRIKETPEQKERWVALVKAAKFK